nr:hypothetical protein [Tanacetum cinerariifolium]
EDGNPARANVKQALGRRSYALSWRPCQGNSLNLPDHRFVFGYSVRILGITDLNAKFEDCSDNSSNELPDDPDMPELEDITYSDDEDVVGAEEEGIDYEEFFTPVARIKAIRLFLAYAFFIGFMVYQMDVKSAFLYGTIEEEVYVCQPLGFEDPDHTDKVKQKKDGIFIIQDEYVAEILRKFGLTEGKSASTPIDLEKPLLKDPDGEDVDVHTYSKEDFRYLKGKPHLGLWYPKDSPFDLVPYSDSDYAGASLDRKSTTGGCQFFGYRLISWPCKKQTIIATLSTEAEYVATASCCAQVLWIQNQLLDYGWNKVIENVVTYILSAGYLTTQQMIINSPCLIHIRIG